MTFSKRAFTLVELIVVITILAILGTIAFISLQGYSVDARNSTRVADLGTINSTLSLNQLRSGKFLPPSLGVEITFSGSEVWTQGTFGNETRQKLGDRGELTKVPKDPLTDNEYTYSVLNTKREISLAAVMEGEYSYNNNLLLNETYAAGREGTVYIKGNYNGKIAKVQTGATTYVLAVPSIISGDITLTDIITTLNQNKLVYNGFHNLPSSYSSGVFIDESPTGVLVNTGNIVVFSGLVDDLKIESIQNELIDKLIIAYTGTDIETQPQIEEIINSSSSNKTLIAQTIIKNTIIPSLEITATTNISTSQNIAFISTWDTSKAGGLTNEYQIQLPLVSNGTYDFVVDWGDGNTNNITAYNQILTYNYKENSLFSFIPQVNAMPLPVTHTYSSTGIYDITITGQLEGFDFNNGGDKTKILDVKNWGPDFRFGGDGIFYGCSNLTGFTATDAPNLEDINSLGNMFGGATSFNGNINHWDVSNIIDMNMMFVGATNFNQPLNNWNVSNLTNMPGMFWLASSFDQDISSWDVSSVTSYFSYDTSTSISWIASEKPNFP